ncbi:MAG: phytanoyl-CoA dioxygenase family protein [Candidatus Handelsmanbacteria bacterium]|nr:phytanoyl-CoA dioxygenase family protein [Candidatus Handelsmanbacteria bacterium]
MEADPRFFRQHGYIVLRNVVPPDQLAGLRDCFETLVEKQKEVWARQRKPDDPPGGVWETAAQPRLVFNNLIDAQTSAAAEFCLHEHTLGISRQLMGTPEAAVTAMLLMCNPVRDHGPAHWHRDVGPGHPAPIDGLVEHIRLHGPAYVQWNIALWEDSVLWVVPGSHLRRNTEEEARQLAADPKVPLPGGLQVELGPGDGVAYTIPILHWGSDYSAKRRRIVHLGYRAFGGPAFSYVHWRHWDGDFVPHLPAMAQQTFARFDALWREEHRRIEAVFRAAIGREAAGFAQALAGLHPGPQGRTTALVMLSKVAGRLAEHKALEAQGLPPAETAAKVKALWFGTEVFNELAGRFSAAEAAQLSGRFAELDRRLRLPAAQAAPGFQGPASQYEPNAMPEGFGVDEFIASW